jgi:hypothetical protein
MCARVGRPVHGLNIHGLLLCGSTLAAIEITATTRVEGEAGSGEAWLGYTTKTTAKGRSTFSTGVRKHIVVAGPEDGGHRDTHVAARFSTSTITCCSLQRLMKWLRSVKSKSPEHGQVENQMNAR